MALESKHHFLHHPGPLNYISFSHRSVHGLVAWWPEHNRHLYADDSVPLLLSSTVSSGDSCHTWQCMGYTLSCLMFHDSQQTLPSEAASCNQAAGDSQKCADAVPCWHLYIRSGHLFSGDRQSTSFSPSPATDISDPKMLKLTGVLSPKQFLSEVHEDTPPLSVTTQSNQKHLSLYGKGRMSNLEQLIHYYPYCIKSLTFW